MYIHVALDAGVIFPIVTFSKQLHVISTYKANRENFCSASFFYRGRHPKFHLGLRSGSVSLLPIFPMLEEKARLTPSRYETKNNKSKI